MVFFTACCRHVHAAAQAEPCYIYQYAAWQKMQLCQSVHASTPTSLLARFPSNWRAAFFPPERKSAAQALSLLSHKGLFVCNLWISVWFVLGEEGGWPELDSTGTGLSSSHFEVASVCYSRLVLSISFVEGENEMRAEMINRWNEWTSLSFCFSLSAFCTFFFFFFFPEIVFDDALIICVNLCPALR